MTETLQQKDFLKTKTDNTFVTVIIPIHKPNIKYFSRCFNSLKKQSFGFKNIEVIIVVHNTDINFFEKIKKATSNYSNVKLFCLNNDKHSASSPRNYGLQFVSNKYVTFLDDDDALQENFIEEAIKYMQNKNVQFVSYARKNIRDDKKIVNIQYNEKESALGKETIYNINEDSNVIPFEQAVFVTGKMFDYDFIKSHNISFNEKIPVFEDFLFVSQVIKNSKAVCVQPHIVGYYYHMNEDGIINHLNRNNTDILDCVLGISKVIEEMKSSKYLAKIELRELVAYVGVTLFSSPDISFSTRCKVKNLIKDYVNILWLVDNQNIYSKTRSKINYKIMEFEILHPLASFILAKMFKLFKIDPITIVSVFTKKLDK